MPPFRFLGYVSSAPQSGGQGSRHTACVPCRSQPMGLGRGALDVACIWFVRRHLLQRGHPGVRAMAIF